MSRRQRVDLIGGPCDGVVLATRSLPPVLRVPVEPPRLPTLFLHKAPARPLQVAEYERDVISAGSRRWRYRFRGMA